jgi:hypothetical protein
MAGRTKQERETASYAAMMRRMLTGYGRRVAGKDIAELKGLADFAADAERVLGETVAVLRTQEGGAYSWADIGEALGITRSAAQKRFGKYDTAPARTIGGQPSNLR